MSVNIQKAALRKHLLEKRDATSAELRDILSGKIHQNLKVLKNTSVGAGVGGASHKSDNCFYLLLFVALARWAPVLEGRIQDHAVREAIEAVAERFDVGAVVLPEDMDPGRFGAAVGPTHEAHR